MKPSETPPGLAWLENFASEDRATAIDLLDSITFVGLGTMRQRLLEDLNGWALCNPERLPALILPVLSIEDINDALGRVGRPKQDEHVAFETFEPGAPIDSTPGSEGWVGQLVRDLVRQRSGTLWLKPSSTLCDLIEAECRSIVLVTDYSGSGTQIVRFADTLTRNPTIRSWRSGGIVDIYAFAFAASPAAEVALDNASSVDEFRAGIAAPSFDDQPWSREQRRAIEELCRRAADGHDQALGYKQSRGLFAMQTSAPNNLPWVLRRRSAGWTPFFEDRDTPAAIAAALGEYQPAHGEAALIAFTGQERLARAMTTRPPVRRESVWLLKLLAHLKPGPTPRAGLAAALQIPLADLDGYLASLQALGMIDEGLNLTPQGDAELSAASRAPRRVAFTAQAKAGEYYPRSMR